MAIFIIAAQTDKGSKIINQKHKCRLLAECSNRKEAIEGLVRESKGYCFDGL